jgi:hypothetical protein
MPASALAHYQSLKLKDNGKAQFWQRDGVRVTKKKKKKELQFTPVLL